MIECDRFTCKVSSLSLKPIFNSVMKKSNIINSQKLRERIKEFAMKVGHVAERQVPMFYYVMRSEETSTKDKLTNFFLE